MIFFFMLLMPSLSSSSTVLFNVQINGWEYEWMNAMNRELAEANRYENLSIALRHTAFCILHEGKSRIIHIIIIVNVYECVLKPTHKNTTNESWWYSPNNIVRPFACVYLYTNSHNILVVPYHEYSAGILARCFSCFVLQQYEIGH